MLLLSPFSKIQNIVNDELFIEGDLQLISEDIIEVSFIWTDTNNLISFANTPAGIRATQLWQQTCFEAFIQPIGGSRYFEINLTTNKSWNVFEFMDYRNPQPPKEFIKADLLSFKVEENEIKAQVKFTGENFKKVKASICAVIQNKNGTSSYWSIKHAGSKPDFHHFESLIIERNAP